MQSLEELFWARVDKGKDHECWEWKGNILHGYGRLKHKGKPFRAHRIAWELHYGQKIPDGMKILHHCDNPKCVNHMHLYCGTDADNMRDKKLRGRSKSDKLSISHATLSADIITLIRKCINVMSAYEVEKELGVNRHIVLRIWRESRYPSSDGHFVEFGGNCELIRSENSVR